MGFSGHAVLFRFHSRADLKNEQQETNLSQRRSDQVGVDAEHRGIAERKRKKPSNASSGFTFLEELCVVAQCASCCVTPTKEASKSMILQGLDSGCFHHSLWLSESHDLLVAEGFDGIEFGGLHGGEPAADHADGDEDSSGEHHGDQRKSQVDVHFAGVVFVGGAEERQRTDC